MPLPKDGGEAIVDYLEMADRPPPIVTSLFVYMRPGGDFEVGTRFR